MKISKYGYHTCSGKKNKIKDSGLGFLGYIDLIILPPNTYRVLGDFLTYTWSMDPKLGKIL